MSIDTALRRAGLLNTSQPIGPSISAIIRSVGDFISAPFLDGWARTSSRSHHPALAEAGDRRGVIAQLAQNLVRMLAAFGRGGAERRRRPAQRHRLADEIEAAEARMLDRLDDAEMLDLGVGEHFVHAVDRTARTAGTIEAIDPFRGC